MAKEKKQKNSVDLQIRPPIVVIMGHVDHGKTSILDYIRKTKVVEKEAGGITQHVGAYQVLHQGKLITFIDTPGHEAFYAMRSRGAKVADIAILVVAADDGIMAQTREAISHIKHAGIPMIIAINKMDKSGADSMRVKNQLLEEQIIVEDLKGKVPSVEVSAKTGKGIDSLLEIINLVAEVEEIKSVTQGKAKGVVVESELNHKRGPTATLLVREGTLKINDILVFSSTHGRIQNMEDFMGREITEASPGTPVIVVGVEHVPLVGEKFKVVESTEVAEKLLKEEQKKYSEEVEVVEVREDMKVINIILKADVQGTLEALHEILRGIKNENDNMSLRILKKSVGEIMESDIKLASAANAFIAGFRTKINQGSENFARQMKVDVVLSDIIYELVEKVRAKIDELIVTEKRDVELGSFKVLAIFRTEKSRMILGGKVLSGEIKRGAKLRVLRNDGLIGEGRVAQLKIKDKEIDKIDKDNECGILYDGPVRVQVGDILQCYVHI